MGLSGKYELVSKQEFQDFLIKAGASEEHSKFIYEKPYVLELKVDSDKVAVSVLNKSTTYPYGEEVDDQIREGYVIKSTATLSGDVLIITSGKSKRVLSPKGNDLQEAITSEKGNVTLIYKRI